ncbi:MAG: DUF4349 domain-containing protein, partial [Bacillota bacterium]
MKRKILFPIVLVLISIFLLASCSSNDSSYSPNEGSEYNEEIEEIESDIILNQSNRKIVYTFDISMTTDDFEESINKINDLVEEDEEAGNWVQTSERYKSGNHRYCNLTLRVKTDTLNDFLQGLESAGEISNQSHTTKDITYTYASTQAKVEALEDEKQYLEDILDEVSTSEKLDYIERISDINSQLMLFNQELTEYDSDVEYSTVKIHLSNTELLEENLSFGNKLKNAFWGSITFVYEALKWIIMALIYILPFAIIGGAITT